MPAAGARRSSAASNPGGELALIERIRLLAVGTGRQSRALRLGIGDDCAILSPPPGHDLLVTTDFSLEGRHFRREWHSAVSIGHRALARGLSDLAAMGAQPLAAFLSLALPRSLARSTDWIDGFLDGLLTLARAHGVPLAGGDTSESPSEARAKSSTAAKGASAAKGRITEASGEAAGHVLADIILLGGAPAGRALRRSGARPGDRLFCTGSLGGAAAELANLATLPRRFRRARADGDHPHLFPQPRLAVGQALLRRRLASACIDLSDGLSTDLAHLCDQSSAAANRDIAAEVDTDVLPLHSLAAALGKEKALWAALHGGEDYELLFTAAPSARVPRSLAGVRLTAIGRIVRRRKGEPQVTLISSGGERSTLKARGWEHLR